MNEILIFHSYMKKIHTSIRERQSIKSVMDGLTTIFFWYHKGFKMLLGGWHNNQSVLDDNLGKPGALPSAHPSFWW